MAYCELDSNFSNNGSAQIIRMEEALYQELVNGAEFLGRVGQIYQNGFDLVRARGGLIHFQREKWLHSPFGAVLDQPIKKWVQVVSLRQGDIFYGKGQFLLRKLRSRCSIYLDSTCAVNLKRTVCSSPPRFEILLSWIRLLTSKIFKWGKFEGMGGTLILLKGELHDLFSDRSVDSSL